MFNHFDEQKALVYYYNADYNNLYDYCMKRINQPIAKGYLALISIAKGDMPTALEYIKSMKYLISFYWYLMSKYCIAIDDIKEAKKYIGFCTIIKEKHYVFEAALGLSLTQYQNHNYINRLFCIASSKTHIVSDFYVGFNSLFGLEIDRDIPKGTKLVFDCATLGLQKAKKLLVIVSMALSLPESTKHHPYYYTYIEINKILKDKSILIEEWKNELISTDKDIERLNECILLFHNDNIVNGDKINEIVTDSLNGHSFSTFVALLLLDNHPESKSLIPEKNVTYQAAQLDIPYYQTQYSKLILTENKDIDLAIHYLEKAANNNDPAAMYELSLIYSEGIYVTANTEKHMQYLTNAALLNYSDAQFLLAQHYIETEDFDTAYDLFNKAAEQNHQFALFCCGYINFIHYKDYPLAFDFFKKAQT